MILISTSVKTGVSGMTYTDLRILVDMMFLHDRMVLLKLNSPFPPPLLKPLLASTSTLWDWDGGGFNLE